MIVLDASVVVELLTNGALADSIRKELTARNEAFIVPHLIDVEIMSALRRLVGWTANRHAQQPPISRSALYFAR
jgi:predicted nucleic acid-binding protein